MLSEQFLPYLIEPLINTNHLSYADNFLLLADNLGALQNAINVVFSRLNENGLSLDTSKLSFKSLDQRSPCNGTIQVVLATISSFSSLRYLLCLPFGMPIRSKR